jgi:hypothetical protein
MQRGSKGPGQREEAREFGPDTIEQGRRERVRAARAARVEEEVDAALGAGRVGEARQGDRQGVRPRRLTTSLGPALIRVPRARLCEEGGGTVEWQSRPLPRSQRRTARVAEALRAVSLRGTNRRRRQGALAPLPQGGPLAQAAGAGVGGRLKSAWEEWRPRDLGPDALRSLLLEGW